METKYFVDETGAYLGAFAATEVGGKSLRADPPVGAIEVPFAPEHAAQPWLGDYWGVIPPEVKK